MIKYRDNMSKEEEAAMMAELAQLDACYADAAALDDEQAALDAIASEEELEEAYQTETLHKAALSRGQP